MNENFNSIKSAFDNISSWTSLLIIYGSTFGQINCEQMGLEDLNEQQCVLLNPSTTECDTSMPPGCRYEYKGRNSWVYNRCGGAGIPGCL